MYSNLFKVIIVPKIDLLVFLKSVLQSSAPKLFAIHASSFEHTNLRLFTFSSFSISGRLLSAVENEMVEEILIVSLFTAQVWFRKRIKSCQ